MIESGVANPPPPRAMKDGLIKIGAAGQQRTNRTAPWTTADKTRENPQRRRRGGCTWANVVHSGRSWSKARSMLFLIRRPDYSSVIKVIHAKKIAVSEGQ